MSCSVGGGRGFQGNKIRVLPEELVEGLSLRRSEIVNTKKESCLPTLVAQLNHAAICGSHLIHQKRERTLAVGSAPCLKH